MQPSQHCLYDVMDGSCRDLNLRPRECENTHELHRVGRINYSAIAPFNVIKKDFEHWQIIYLKPDK